MTGGRTLPSYHTFLSEKSKCFNCYISSRLKQISTKLHFFAKFSMVNLLMDPVFHFTKKNSDILKRDVTVSFTALRSTKCSERNSERRWFNWIFQDVTLLTLNG